MNIVWKNPKNLIRSIESIGWISDYAEVRSKGQDTIDLQVMEENRVHFSRLVLTRDHDWLSKPTATSSTCIFRFYIHLPTFVQTLKHMSEGDLVWSHCSPHKLFYYYQEQEQQQHQQQEKKNGKNEKRVDMMHSMSIISSMSSIAPTPGIVTPISTQTMNNTIGVVGDLEGRMSKFDDWMSRTPSVTIQEPAIFQSLVGRLSLMNCFFQLAPLETRQDEEKLRWLMVQASPLQDLQYLIPMSAEQEERLNENTTNTEATMSSTTKMDGSQKKKRRSSEELRKEHSKAFRKRVLGRNEADDQGVKKRSWMLYGTEEEQHKQEHEASKKEHPETSVKSEKSEKPGTSEKSEKPEKSEKSEKSTVINFDMGMLYERVRPSLTEWASQDLWDRHNFSLDDVQYMLSKVSTQMLWQLLLTEGTHISLSATKLVKLQHNNNNAQLDVLRQTFEYGAKTTALNQLMNVYKQKYPEWLKRASVTNTQWHHDDAFCLKHDIKLPIHQISNEGFERLVNTSKQVGNQKWCDLVESDLLEMDILELILSSPYSRTLQTIETYHNYFEWRDILLVPRDIDEKRSLILVQRIIPLTKQQVNDENQNLDLLRRRLVNICSGALPLVQQPRLVAVQIPNVGSIICLGMEEMCLFSNRSPPPPSQAASEPSTTSNILVENEDADDDEDECVHKKAKK